METLFYLILSALFFVILNPVQLPNLYYFAVNDIQVHLKTLRTSFTKLSRLPSGSGADRLTQRQRDILDMCKFLRAHIRTCEGITTLQRRTSPRKSPVTKVCSNRSYRIDRK